MARKNKLTIKRKSALGVISHKPRIKKKSMLGVVSRKPKGRVTKGAWFHFRPISDKVIDRAIKRHPHKNFMVTVKSPRNYKIEPEDYKR